MALSRKMPVEVDNKTRMIIIAVIAAAALALAIFIGASHNGGDNAVPISEKEAAQARDKGLELYRQGKWDGALEQLTKAVAGNPKDLHARFQLAYAYEQKGELDNAYAQYQEVLKINKDSADAHYSAGRVLLQKGQLEKAIAEFEAAATLDADFTSVRVALAEAYTQKKEYQKALETYGELEKIINSDALYLSRIHVSKGKIYDEMGKSRDAKAEFRKALALDKNNQEAIAGLK